MRRHPRNLTLSIRFLITTTLGCLLQPCILFSVFWVHTTAQTLKTQLVKCLVSVATSKHFSAVETSAIINNTSIFGVLKQLYPNPYSNKNLQDRATNAPVGSNVDSNKLPTP